MPIPILLQLLETTPFDITSDKGYRIYFLSEESDEAYVK